MECWLYLVLLVDVNSLRHEILNDIFVALSGSPVDGAVTSVVDKALKRHEQCHKKYIHTSGPLFAVFLSLVLLFTVKETEKESQMIICLVVCYKQFC